MKKNLAVLAAIGLAPAFAWGASHQMRVTFSGYAGRTETLRNFPALVEFSDPSRPFFDADHASDLRFYGQDLKMLPHEIDTVEPGRVLVWVLVPELTPNGSAGILAVWGDDPGISALPVAEVWPADFKLVWHFNGPVGEDVRDSTANGYHGRIHVPAGGPALGAVGNAADLSNGPFRNNGLYLRDTAGIAVGNAWTIGAWYKDLLPSGTQAGDNGWRTLARGPGANHHVIVEETSARLGAHTGAFNWADPAELPPDGGEWRHLAAVAQNGWTTFYTNGVFAGSGNFVANNPVFGIGCYHGVNNPTPASAMSPNQKFADHLDEVRVATAPRSADWVWAEFQNQDAPGNFSTFTPADLSGSFFVAGSPAGVGVAVPAFGLHGGFAAGISTNVFVSPVWTSGAGDVFAFATGWTVSTNTPAGGWSAATNGVGAAFTHTHPGALSKITWGFTVSNLLTVAAAGPGGTVTGGGWCESGGGLWVEAFPTPDSANSFLQWTGGLEGMPAGSETQNPLFLPGDRPRAVEAEFTRYVAPTGRSLVWDNANAENHLWDTVSINWLDGGTRTAFQYGDTVTFNTPAEGQSVQLAGDTTVNQMAVNVPPGGVWELNGTAILTVPGPINAPLAFNGPGEMVVNTPYDANHVEMRGGTVRYVGGHESTVRNRTYFAWGGTTTIITNATLHSLPIENFSMGSGSSPGGDRNAVRVQKDGVLNVKTIRMGENSAHNLLQVDGGTMNMAGNINFTGGASGNSNRLEVVNGGTLNSANGISMGVRDFHSFLFDNATVALDDGNTGSGAVYIFLGNGGGTSSPTGLYHSGAITNSSVTAGRVAVGQAFSWSRLAVFNSTLVCQVSGNHDGFYVGNGGSNCRADIVDSVVDIPRNGVCVGGNGHSNVLNIVNSTVTCAGWGFNISRGSGGDNLVIVGQGANLIANNQITLSQNGSNPGGNELRLAGGSITTNGELEWWNKSVLGVEIQTNGLPGWLSVGGSISVHADTIVRPRAVRGALPGTYLVFESTGNAILPENFTFQPPEGQKDRWSCELVGGKKLFVTYRPPYTLFMVR